MRGVRGKTFAIGCSQLGNIEIGKNNSERINIGANNVQMMTFAVRNEGAMLPIALPMARKVIIPKMSTPKKANQAPRI